MSTDTLPAWQSKQTEESSLVETKLRDAGFEKVDAYRHNSASLRVRIVDERFRGKTNEQRNDMVEPHLAQLHPDTQADIINLILIYPGEEKDSHRAAMFNDDFERAESAL